MAEQGERIHAFENPSEFSGLSQNLTIQEFPKLSTSLSRVEDITAHSREPSQLLRIPIKPSRRIVSDDRRIDLDETIASSGL
jgi:hypothetical protein